MYVTPFRQARVGQGSPLSRRAMFEEARKSRGMVAEGLKFVILGWVPESRFLDPKKRVKKRQHRRANMPTKRAGVRKTRTRAERARRKRRRPKTTRS
jgi:hypothetical protein